MNENMPSAEEIAKMEKSRAISDAELLKGGAEYAINEVGEKSGVNLTVAQRSHIEGVESKSVEYQARLKAMKESLENLRITTSDKIVIEFNNGNKREFTFFGLDTNGSVRAYADNSGEEYKFSPMEIKCIRSRY